MARRLFVVSAVCGALLVVGAARAQNHEKCYKIKDPLKFAGNVDLSSTFGLEAGCVVSSAKYFCVPASKTVNSATDVTTGLPIVPLPLYAPPAPSDRICYKIKCPKSVIADQSVTDQFGNRTYPGSKFKAVFMCTPAVQGAGFCGNGVIDPGEACDSPALGACTVGCQPDCTCTCETACCYVEDTSSPPETQCFQYSGTPAQVLAFGSACTLGVPPGPVPGSLPATLMFDTAAFGPCVAGPIFGFPCVPGGPGVGNLHMLPADSSCP